jgi:hypothetical protein
MRLISPLTADVRVYTTCKQSDFLIKVRNATTFNNAFGDIFAVGPKAKGQNVDIILKQNAKKAL